MEGYCSTGQNPQWAVVPVEEEEEEEDDEEEEEEYVYISKGGGGTEFSRRPLFTNNKLPQKNG
jgi:hypothetical protein